MLREVSLAHLGVLFLDEIPEFSKSALEVLRQTLEDREVTLGRARAVLTFPAEFMLISSMNPCPCGFFGYEENRTCTCTPHQIRRYRSKISGPLLDRIDHCSNNPSTWWDSVPALTTASSKWPALSLIWPEVGKSRLSMWLRRSNTGRWIGSFGSNRSERKGYM
jgi:magnesium chelatase family protein